MKIIEPFASLVSPCTLEVGVEMLQKIENFARVSHRSEDKQTPDSWRRFLQSVVMERGDWSVVEHQSATVAFRVDRGVLFELTRHRLFSFTAESTRFVNYQKRGEMEFVVPEGLSQNSLVFADWKIAMDQAEAAYLNMLANGFPPQTARSVLPNALASTVIVTGNLRQWRLFFLMRATRETHPDFRRVVISLLAEFKKVIPIFYDDIKLNVRQIDNLSKPR